MNTSSATLTSLWVDESPTKLAHMTTPTKANVKQEFEQYIRDTDGLGSLAKQVTLSLSHSVYRNREVEVGYQLTLQYN